MFDVVQYQKDLHDLDADIQECLSKPYDPEGMHIYLNETIWAFLQKHGLSSEAYQALLEANFWYS